MNEPNLQWYTLDDFKAFFKPGDWAYMRHRVQKNTVRKVLITAVGRTRVMYSIDGNALERAATITSHVWEKLS